VWLEFWTRRFALFWEEDWWLTGFLGLCTSGCLFGLVGFVRERSGMYRRVESGIVGHGRDLLWITMTKMIMFNG